MSNFVHAPNALGDDHKIAAGQHTTVGAADTINTGLKNVRAVVATLNSDPVDGAMTVTAVVGSNGQITIKGWKSTDADATQVAATTFGLTVNWVAFGE